MQALSPNGVLGDPRGANSELGRELNELTVTLYAEAVLAALRRDE